MGDRLRPAESALEWVLEGEEWHLDARVLFLRARPLDLLRSAASLDCVQTLRPLYESLRDQGFAVEREVAGQDYDLALVMGTAQKEETLANLAEGLRRLKPGGRVVCTLPNNLGAGSLEKALEKESEEIFTSSKRKCRVFGAIKEHINADAVKTWWTHGQPCRSEATGLWTQPGIFGWNKLDNGTRLLGESLPPDLSGVGADLGCGNGYLGVRLLERAQQVRALHCFEAEDLALRAARRNLEGHGKVVYHWQDVTEGVPDQQFDFVITNPPFHREGRQDLELGLRFVEQAAACLRPGGHLWMVCNLNLPYEKVLEGFFKTHALKQSRDGFKVLWAQR